VHLGRVLDRLQIAGRVAGEAELADRGCSISQEPRFEPRIDPGARDDGGAALGSNLVTIRFDPSVDRGSMSRFAASRLSSALVRSAGSDGRSECSSWWIWEIVFESKLAIARFLRRLSSRAYHASARSTGGQALSR
jgi:hypothetical protein